jgi:hypothetical protein
MNKVWVVQENNYIDYSDAERFGEVNFITRDEIKPIRGSLINESIMTRIDSTLEQFGEDDYLVLTGNPAVIGYAFHKAAERCDVVNVLLWDKIGGRYRPLEMEIR